jgi:hypothetical protein
MFVFPHCFIQVVSYLFKLNFYKLVFFFRRLNLYTIFMLPFQITFKAENILFLADTCNSINKEKSCA